MPLFQKTPGRVEPQPARPDLRIGECCNFSPRGLPACAAAIMPPDGRSTRGLTQYGVCGLLAFDRPRIDQRARQVRLLREPRGIRTVRRNRKQTSISMTRFPRPITFPPSAQIPAGQSTRLAELSLSLHIQPDRPGSCFPSTTGVNVPASLSGERTLGSGQAIPLKVTVPISSSSCARDCSAPVALSPSRMRYWS